MMKTLEKKDKGGRPPLGALHQKEQFVFRTTREAHGVWLSYSKNLGLTQTELFYKLVLLVGTLDAMFKHYEKTAPDMIVGKESEWQTIMMLIKCCDNISTMNAGRVKQFEENRLEANKVKNASDILHEHFDTEWKKSFKMPESLKNL